MIKEVINKLTNGIKPEESELYETFDEIFSGIADEVLAVSFVSLLKGFCLDDEEYNFLITCIKSANSAVKSVNLGVNPDYAVQVSEFDSIDKYGAVILARDIILSTNDIPVTRCDIYDPLKENNFLKLMEKFKIAPYNKDSKEETDIEKFEKNNYYYILLNKKESYLKYTSNISKKLCFENIFNTTNKLLNPCKSKNIIIGTNKIDNVEKIAGICLKLNYVNSMLISSTDNIPLVSPENESYIAEAWKNKIFAYKLTPELIGLKSHQLKEIESTATDEQYEIIKNLFMNKIKDSAFYDTVVMNSALGLYIVKKADSIMNGIELSKKTIDSGLAYEKIQSYMKE